MLQHGAGFGHRHLAGQQRRHLLHRRRSASSRFQTQGIVGGKTPRFAPPAPATATPNPHRPEPARIGSFLSGTEPVQFIAPNRANRRTPIGFLLRRFFQKLSLQIAHRLVAVGDAPVQTGHQTLQPVQDRLVKRLVTAVGLRNQFQAAVPQALNFTTSPKIKPLKNETRPRRAACGRNSLAHGWRVDKVISLLTHRIGGFLF